MGWGPHVREVTGFLGSSGNVPKTNQERPLGSGSQLVTDLNNVARCPPHVPSLNTPTKDKGREERPGDTPGTLSHSSLLPASPKTLGITLPGVCFLLLRGAELVRGLGGRGAPRTAQRGAESHAPPLPPLPADAGPSPCRPTLPPRSDFSFQGMTGFKVQTPPMTSLGSEGGSGAGTSTANTSNWTVNQTDEATVL